MNEHKIKNVFGLDSKERYGYLLRKVADFETIYLIADNEDKYVMIGSDEVSVIPVWPEKEFADLFLTDDQKDYKVLEYSIYDFMDWLDDLDKENIELAGFPNIDFNTVHVSEKDMKNHLLQELRRGSEINKKASLSHFIYKQGKTFMNPYPHYAYTIFER